MITLDEARPPEIASLLAAGYGLTRREQDVVRLVVLGVDTAAIGAQLFLSPHIRKASAPPDGSRDPP